MNTVKATVYSALSTIAGATVQQSTQQIATTMPVIAYRISQNAPSYDFDKEISLQDVEVMIDIFATTSTGASSLLSQVEAKMKGIDLFLTYTADVPDPDGYFHINTRFGGEL